MADPRKEDVKIVLTLRDLDLLVDLTVSRLMAQLGGQAVYDIHQASEFTGLTPNALRQRVRRGTLSAMRIGRLLQFRKEELERLKLKQRKSKQCTKR